MSNEVAEKELEIGVTFKQSNITITNKAALEAAVDGYSKKYTGLVITQDTLQEAKKTRAEINRVVKGLDDKRKEIKKQYNEPLKAFETEVKVLTGKLNESAVPIDTGIKELEDREADQRLQEVNDIIAEMAPNYDLAAEEYLVESNLLLKSLSKKKRVEMIADGMKLMRNNKIRLEADKQSIKKYAEAVGLEADGWVNMVSAGKPLVDAMHDIDSAMAKRKSDEQKAKHKAEYDAAIEALKSRSIGDKKVNIETGEIIPEVSKTVTHALQVTCDDGEYEELIQYLILSSIYYKEEQPCKNQTR